MGGILETMIEDVNHDHEAISGGVGMTSMRIGILLGILFPAIALAGSVELEAFADKPVCEQVVKLFSQRFVPDAELLHSVEWTPVEVAGEGPKTRRCSSLDRAIMDVNNDGRDDLVVKTTFCMKGTPSDSLYVFPADSPVLEQVSWQDMSPLVFSPDKFERTGGTYPLTALAMEKVSSAPVLTTLFTVQPFRLDGVAYVSLTDARREWMVIAKYRGGERFEDLCYLRASTF